MSDESERRIKKLMDKLYHFPTPSKPSPSSRNELDTRFGMRMGFRVPIVRTLAAAPCRPWDRTDLLRRLTTFKAMTWFAKPKVISPVNCARRGWINIEVDVISCEACGARLLFSTPSSWSLDQVEKAASVFSLKLDSGHRPLCPWIDNPCEESLSHFPPTLPTTLAKNYRENLSLLSELSSLPVISRSAIGYLEGGAPQLEGFLKGKGVMEGMEVEGLGFRVSEEGGLKEVEGMDRLVEDSDLYTQALKLISLCGWEPHQLPYSVDRVNPATSSHEPQTLNPKPSTSPTDPSSSFLLQCSFCGARAALWTFKSIQRPLRLFKLETSNKGAVGNNEGPVCDNSGKVGGINVKSIGGGPPPSRQRFKPRVSFPVVSRGLRCDLEGFGGLKRKRSGEDLSECGDGESIVERHDGNDEFDPVKQHRTFCPWISPEGNSEILPGWKLTFLALLSQQKEKDGEGPPEERERQSSLLDEEEDPVVSVRRLFTASPSKRAKLKNTQ